MKAIDINNLTKTYGKARGITDLSFSVEQGDVFGFIGPNGAGKSTTIRALLGLIYPNSGNASIFGYDIVKQHKEVLSKIGYMPSEAQFYPQMRVKDVISLSADLHKKRCHEEANRLCERFQMDVNKRVEELSLGNRKKVSIVCALQHKPELCIFDEPTSGLDPLMQKEFFDVLEERNKEGATIFFSSHVLPEIQKHCNHAAVIREGKLIRVSSVEELTAGTAKRVTIHGVSEVPEIDGCLDIQKHVDGVSFLYNKDINQLIQAISKQKVEDLIITEPSLDEIFLHYYEKETTV